MDANLLKARSVTVCDTCVLGGIYCLSWIIHPLSPSFLAFWVAEVPLDLTLDWFYSPSPLLLYWGLHSLRHCEHVTVLYQIQLRESGSSELGPPHSSGLSLHSLHPPPPPQLIPPSLILYLPFTGMSEEKLQWCPRSQYYPPPPRRPWQLLRLDARWTPRRLSPWLWNMTR
jgi:hypothetical protein